jgi:hypothetical protein
MRETILPTLLLRGGGAWEDRIEALDVCTDAIDHVGGEDASWCVARAAGRWMSKKAAQAHVYDAQCLQEGLSRGVKLHFYVSFGSSVKRGIGSVQMLWKSYFE